MTIHEQLQHIKTLMSDELLEAIAAGDIDMASEVTECSCPNFSPRGFITLSFKEGSENPAPSIKLAVTEIAPEAVGDSCTKLASLKGNELS